MQATSETRDPAEGESQFRFNSQEDFNESNTVRTPKNVAPSEFEAKPFTAGTSETTEQYLGQVCPQCSSEVIWCTCRRNRRHISPMRSRSRSPHQHHRQARRNSSPHGHANVSRSNHIRPPLPTDEWRWRLTLKDVAKAVEIASNSSPGPDGIPYAAWKLSGELALQVLYDVAVALQSDDASSLLREMHGDDWPDEGHGFNLGLLICLGKKAHSQDPVHGAVFHAANTRPLSIVNTDNRILANAARLRWERILNPWISPQQQGFLGNRSILKNVLDIDYAAMVTALTSDKGALVLFDFAAAFPSISQTYMMDLLTSLGLPRCALNLIQAFYDNNRCLVQNNGFCGSGFRMTAGVRRQTGMPTVTPPLCSVRRPAYRAHPLATAICSGTRLRR